MIFPAGALTPPQNSKFQPPVELTVSEWVPYTCTLQTTSSYLIQIIQHRKMSTSPYSILGVFEVLYYQLVSWEESQHAYILLSLVLFIPSIDYHLIPKVLSVFGLNKILNTGCVVQKHVYHSQRKLSCIAPQAIPSMAVWTSNAIGTTTRACSRH